MATRVTCPVCLQYQLVGPGGPASAPILLVGEFPGWQEEKMGIPFVGQAGDILRAELGRVGIQYNTCRKTNLWQHKPTKNEADLDWMISQLAAELKKARHVLFMGSECASTLFQVGVMDACGLKVKSPLLPDNIKTAMIAPNPASLIHDTVGEFRMALSRFAKAAA